MRPPQLLPMMKDWRIYIEGGTGQFVLDVKQTPDSHHELSILLHVKSLQKHEHGYATACRIQQ